MEFRNAAVTEELKYWARWLLESLPCDGFRRRRQTHSRTVLQRVGGSRARSAQRDLFIVAEYWSHDLSALQQYIELVDGKVMLFDVALHLKFHQASKQGDGFDMAQIFTDTLTAADPAHAVTLVANHDTQPLQSLEAPVEPWFKPLAYALILLREQGVPCVFTPTCMAPATATRGATAASTRLTCRRSELEKLIAARQRFANGPQTDYFDDSHCVAFSRAGTAEAPGCVVVLTNGGESGKTVALGTDLAHTARRDFLGNRQEEITTDDQAAPISRSTPAASASGCRPPA